MEGHERGGSERGELGDGEEREGKGDRLEEGGGGAGEREKRKEDKD